MVTSAPTHESFLCAITDDIIRYGDNHPEQCAIDFGTSRYAYGELLNAIHSFATGLGTNDSLDDDDSPMSRGQRCVAMLMPNSIEFLQVFLGTALAGEIAMILNPEWPIERIRHVLTRWTPDSLIAESPQLARIGWETLQHQWPSVVAIAPIPSPSSLSPPPSPRFPLPPSILFIGFTSGTTGIPKGVIRSHDSWIRSIQAGRVEFPWSDDEHVFVPGAFVHSLSLYSAVEALANGATLHGLPRFTPKAAIQRCLDAPITRLIAVPTLLGAIARAASRSSITFPTVRSVISGGSKLSPSLRSHLHTTFPNARILEYYGASELSFVTLASSDEPVPPESVGRPFHHVEVSVRRDDGTAAPPGEIGWIGVRSEMICSGYLASSPGSPLESPLKSPEDLPNAGTTRTGFRMEQGWATVGDRGWLDDNGYLYLAGREGDMLICNGINVYPAEIEAVLTAHPTIEEAVVLGLPDDCRGDRLCALIKAHSPLTRQALLTSLLHHLPPSKCPRQFLEIDAFPLNSSGKIDRVALKHRLLNRLLNSSPIK